MQVSSALATYYGNNARSLTSQGVEADKAYQSAQRSPSRVASRENTVAEQVVEGEVIGRRPADETFQETYENVINMKREPYRGTEFQGQRNGLMAAQRAVAAYQACAPLVGLGGGSRLVDEYA